MEPYRYGGYLVTDDRDKDILVQLDYDFPGLASTFGWSPSMAGKRRCADGCQSTDGTIGCPTCGTPAGRYIESAAKYLDGCGSKIVEDPGYFAETE